MIGVSAATRSIIDDGNFVYHVAVSSWLGDELLAENMPVSDGGEEVDLGLAVPERITLTLPRRDKGVDWMPDSQTHPLSASGQILKVALGVEGTAGIEWFQRGEYVLLSTLPESDGDAVRVTAVGKLYLIEEAGFVAPFQPSGTIAGTLRALIEPALSADLDMAPGDRAVPGTINFDTRLGAVNELLDAWPAVAGVNRQGYLEVLPDTVPTLPVRSFTNAYGGTLIWGSGSSSREGGFNVVVATGSAADGGEVRGQAYVTSGPWAYGVGPANPLPVPFGYSSPLLTTVDQCNAAAETVMRRKVREAVARRFTIECTPDPTVQAGDPVAITTDQVSGLLCTVQRLSLPYVPGRMSMEVVAV